MKMLFLTGKRRRARPRHWRARDSITGVRRNVSRGERKRVSRECAGRASALKQTLFRLLFGYIRANEESGPFTFQFHRVRSITGG